jgi:hypothetical protein
LGIEPTPDKTSVYSKMASQKEVKAGESEESAVNLSQSSKDTKSQAQGTKFGSSLRVGD